MNKTKLRIIPLGGVGEIGKNMNALEYGDDIIILDLGSKFASDDEPGVDAILPDTRYLERNKHKIRGAVITHGHMDHIGGVGHFLKKFPVPVFGAPFTIAMIKRQLEEAGLHFKPQLRVINPDTHERVQLGQFNIELVRVGHPIPDATAIVIRTPVGVVVDTGDWRFEDDPIIGRPMDIARFKELAQEGVTLLMGDSTNALVPGSTAKERDIVPAFDELFSRAPGRVILSMFASNIFRIQLAINATAKSGRKLVVTGRSMLANIETAINTGHLKVPAGLIARTADGIASSRITILTTGSQGEPNSGLWRMAAGEHKAVKIKPGDSVILSSSIIPGNWERINELVDSLMREGAKVYQHSTRHLDGAGILHASGHASREDLMALLKLLKPKHLVPIHGNYSMQLAHASIAGRAGIGDNNIFILNIGNVLELSSKSVMLGEPVESGEIYLQGLLEGRLGDEVIHERVKLSSEGVVIVNAVVSATSGKLMGRPSIVSRGFVHMKDNQPLINQIALESRKAIEKACGVSVEISVREYIGDQIKKATGRQPLVLTAITKV